VKTAASRKETARLRGRGDGGGAVELPDEALVGGHPGVGHRRLDPVQPTANPSDPLLLNN
jgi:hypothetical protein